MTPSGQPPSSSPAQRGFLNRVIFVIILVAVAFTTVLFLSSPPSPDGAGIDNSEPSQTRRERAGVPNATASRKTVLTALDTLGTRPAEEFTDLKSIWARWDAEVGCDAFREKYRGWERAVNYSAVQPVDDWPCEAAKLRHVHAVARLAEKSWFPHYFDGLYQCRCGVSCVWTTNEIFADKADVAFYESVDPPPTRNRGEPLRATIDIEVTRKPRGIEDIFVSYHASADVQVAYPGKMHFIIRSYFASPKKRSDVPVYWSSSRCLSYRDKTAREFMSLVTTHSFGRCENNVGGGDTALDFYPECRIKDVDPAVSEHWWAHLHCAMSHYKFALAIENAWVDSYITEKLYFPLEAGTVPIYFGADDVWNFVPPSSIIEARKFKTMEALAAYVKTVASDPVAYAEFHAWRRCGVFGNFPRARAASLDTLPCRLCEFASRKGGRGAPAAGDGTAAP